jgi:hypothetical protein
MNFSTHWGGEIGSGRELDGPTSEFLVF